MMNFQKFLSLICDIPLSDIRIGFDYISDEDEDAVIVEAFESMPVRALVKDWYGDREFLSFNNALVSSILVYLDGGGIGTDSVHEFDEYMSVARLISHLENLWEIPVAERKYRCYVSWYAEKKLVCSAQRWYHIEPAEDVLVSKLYEIRDRNTEEVLMAAPWHEIMMHFEVC